MTRLPAQLRGCEALTIRHVPAYLVPDQRARAHSGSSFNPMFENQTKIPPK
jgi:hypothetical protein